MHSQQLQQAQPQVARRAPNCRNRPQPPATCCCRVRARARQAIEHYSRARDSYTRLVPPPSYRTATQRAWELVAGAGRGVLAVCRWLVALPGALLGLARWSRDDWSAWWAKVKKVAKEEGQHYWVSPGGGG